MEILIRRAKVGDESVLAYIQTESWKAAFRHMLAKDTLARYTSVDKATDMYRRLLQEERGNGYLLLLDGEPHCIAWWDVARDKEHDGKAELICIHSLPGNWGKGYGSMMMGQILFDIKKSGFTEVVLWVFKDNIIARVFYEAQGFFLTEHIKNELGAEEVCYLKNLK